MNVGSLAMKSLLAVAPFCCTSILTVTWPIVPKDQRMRVKRIVGIKIFYKANMSHLCPDAFSHK